MIENSENLGLPIELTAICNRARYYVIVRFVFDLLLLPLTFLSVVADGRYPGYGFIGIDLLGLLLYQLAVRRWPSISTYLALILPAILVLAFDFNLGQVLIFTWFFLIPLSLVGGIIVGRTGFNSLVTISLLVLLGVHVGLVVLGQAPLTHTLPLTALTSMAITLGVVLLVLNALVETLIVHLFQTQEKLIHTEVQLLHALSELENSRVTFHSVQQRMRRSERFNTIAQVAAQLSKSIQAPLSNIQRLLDAPTGEAWDRSMVEQIRSDLDAIVRITEGLQHFADLKPPQIKTVNLDDLVVEELSLIKTPSEIHIHYQQPPLVPPIQADPDQIRMLFRHLLENALQAVKEGGDIIIELQPSPEGVRLSVGDSGPGIPPAQIDQIFEPLFTTQQQGFGLGLVICQQIVQMHGGSIKVANREEGGAWFSVYLPRIPHDMPQEMAQDIAA